MFELFERVIIKSKNLTGIIVDISENDDGTIYVVESDEKESADDGYGGLWPLFDCSEDELSKIN